MHRARYTRPRVLNLFHSLSPSPEYQLPRFSFPNSMPLVLSKKLQIISQRCIECKHWLARTSYEKGGVYLPVRPFVCQPVIYAKTKETCANILIPHERSFILVSWQEEFLVGATPSIWSFGSNWPCWKENADFQPIFARSTPAVTPSEKSSSNINRKSTKRWKFGRYWPTLAIGWFSIYFRSWRLSRNT